MRRYIDADALQRHGQRGGLVHWKDIDDAPSIDIVRCKECRWDKAQMIPKEVKCIYQHKADDFCSYGEREGE